MTSTVPELKRELGPMLALAVPVALAELGWMAMGVVDTMVVGRVSAEALGAVSVGRALFFTVGVIGLGLLLGLDTLVSHAYGAGKLADCHRSLIHGIYLSLAAGLPLTLAIRATVPLLPRLGIDPSVQVIAIDFVRAISWSLLPLLLATAFRRYLQAISRPRPVLLALVSANVVNLVGNYLLVFGHWGLPALGAAGSGWATCISTWIMALVLALGIVVHDREERGGLWRVPLSVEPARLSHLLRLGVPAAGQLLLEVAVFATATALAGRLDPTWLAAHQIALTAASVTFMVPLGVASAGAVRVGQALGRRDGLAAAHAGWTALALGAGFMLFAALTFLVGPALIVRAFTFEARVVSAGVALLAIAAFFQLSDGLQVVATGLLRGAGDTRTPMLWNLIGHWLVGLPCGYYLGFVRGQGAPGLWIGLLAGLTVTGAALVVVWARRSRRLMLEAG